MKIDLQNIDQWCILYIDNALTSEEKAAFIQFIAENKEAHLLLQSYQNTKLTNEEELIFEDKALLYRFDSLEAALDLDFKKQLYKKEANYFSFPTWSKWSAGIAALFILFWSTRFITFPNKNISEPKNIVEIRNTKIEPTLQEKDIMLATHDVKNRKIHLKTISILQNNNTNTISNNLIDKSGMPLNQESKQDVLIVSSIQTPHATNTEAITLNTANIEKEKINNIETNLIPEDQTSITNDDENDRVIYIGNLEINGDKLRGVTRRINAFIKRTKITDKEKE